jgi:membrane protein involved in colicin uptake
MATKKSAKKAPAAKAKAKAEPAAKPAAAKRNGSLDPTSKFVWVESKENPFKVGSGAHQRVEIIKKLSGQPVAAIQGYKGLHKTTLRTCLRLGLGRVAP